mgnify:CR=1 FL=1
MSLPTSEQQSLLDTFDTKEYLDHVAYFLTGPIDSRYREGVLMNLKTASFMAKKVFAVQLDQDCCDLAAVFRPAEADEATLSEEF